MSFSLSRHLLISMPQMQDEFFSTTLVYLFEHNANGAMGFVINKPLELGFERVLKELDIEHYAPKVQMPVYAGGPVAVEQGFILHQFDRQRPNSQSNGQLVLCTSKDMLTELGRGEGPDEYLFFLGYSGWGAGQLEQELADNAWLTVEADADLIFRTADEQKYHQALSKMGVDPAALVATSGHA